MPGLLCNDFRDSSTNVFRAVGVSCRRRQQRLPGRIEGPVFILQQPAVWAVTTAHVHGLFMSSPMCLCFSTRHRWQELETNTNMMAAPVDGSHVSAQQQEALLACMQRGGSTRAGGDYRWLCICPCVAHLRSPKATQLDGSQNRFATPTHQRSQALARMQFACVIS